MYFRLIWPLIAVMASGQTISNFAGNGTPGYGGNFGPATQAQINHVVGLTSDATGNIYLADENNNVVRRVDTNGGISTFAGTAAAGHSGDGGPTSLAQFNGPQGVCMAPSGVLYINDQGNHRVRAVSLGGVVTTVAGNSTVFSTGDGGPALGAGLVMPVRCAVDRSGNLYIVDQGAHVIRKVNTTFGVISTFAGVNNTPGFSGDGGLATQAQMNSPTAVSVDAAGNLYVTDQLNQRIRKIDTSGIITTVAGNGTAGFAGDGGPAVSASLNFPGGTVVDVVGNLFIVDTMNQVIRKVSGGIISTVAGTPGIAGNAGDGGPPLQARFSGPFAIALDPRANLYVGDTNNHRVRKLSGVASGPPPCSYALDSGGQAFPAAGGTGSIAITTAPGCSWNVAGTPFWVTNATAGSGSGTVGYQVLANAGNARGATFTVAGISVTIEQQAALISGLSFIGSMAHLAAEENWTTTFTLINKSGFGALARLSLFGDAGDPTGNGPLTLPLAFPQQGSGSLLSAATLDRTLGGNASLIVNTAAVQSQPVQVGAAQLEAAGAMDGFAIFHQIATTQEAVVPLETRQARSYLLAFDNTNGSTLGIAVQNVSSQDAIIPIVIRDDTGQQIGTGATISLAGHGHTSFVLSDPFHGFKDTANKRGTIEFDTPDFDTPDRGRIGVLGLRFTPPNSALTTIPALANVTTGGGSFAHFASGGDGWQTTFVLVNTGTGAARATLRFFADQTGAPLSLPVSFPQAGIGIFTQNSFVTQTLAAGATLVVQSYGAEQLLTGSAQLTTDGYVSGFVIFRHNGQEAVVPLESRNASGYIVAFDNTAGTATGVAVNAVSSQQVNVGVRVRNDAGTLLASDTIPLAANGHYAFTLGSDRYPDTANIRGTVEFTTPDGAQIGALGIRIPNGAAHTYTTLPALAK